MRVLSRISMELDDVGHGVFVQVAAALNGPAIGQYLRITCDGELCRHVVTADPVAGLVIGHELNEAGEKFLRPGSNEVARYRREGRVAIEVTDAGAELLRQSGMRFLEGVVG